MKQCPKCGGATGFFTKGRITGTVIWREGFQGEEIDNGDMYENTSVRGEIRAYCIDCEKWIGRATDIREEADHGKG